MGYRAGEASCGTGVPAARDPSPGGDGRLPGGVPTRRWLCLRARLTAGLSAASHTDPPAWSASDAFEAHRVILIACGILTT